MQYLLDPRGSGGFRSVLEAMIGKEYSANVQLRAQRRFAKLVQGLSHLDYGERRQILNSPSVSIRMDHPDLIVEFRCFAIVFRNGDKSASLKRPLHHLKFRKDSSRLDLRIAAFSQIVVFARHEGDVRFCIKKQNLSFLTFGRYHPQI